MTEEKLVRGIGRWDLTALVINCIIGAGIFGLPSKVYALIGTYSLFAFVVCALIVGLIVLCYSEVASRFKTTGGPYLYAKESGMGSLMAFEVGWLYWVVRVATFAANCNLFVTYVGVFWPGATDQVSRLSIIALVVLLLASINIMGIRQSAWVTNVFTIGKLVPLFVFALVGLLFIHPENFRFAEVPAYSTLSGAVLLLIYAFLGFEVAVIPAGEVKDPQKNYPFALIGGLGIVALIYILVQIVSIGTLPSLATSERPLADAAGSFMGPIGAAFIAIGALVSILGNLNAGLIGGSRILYAMGEQGEMPLQLASTHARFRTPYISLILNAVVIFVLTAQSSFLTAVAIATITRLLVYATTCISLPIFRKKPDVPRAEFKAPFGVVAAILSLALILWLLTNVDFKKEGLPIVVLAVIGILIFFVNRMIRRPSAS